jgi:hypothetical protein
MLYTTRHTGVLSNRLICFGAIYTGNISVEFVQLILGYLIRFMIIYANQVCSESF